MVGTPRDNLDVDAEVVAQLPIGLCVCDAPDGMLRLYNRRAAELWGREPRLQHPDERYTGAFRMYDLDGTPIDPIDTAIARALRTGEPQTRDMLVGRPDGSRIAVHAHAVPLRDGGGRIVGAMVTYEDMPLRQQAEDAAAFLAAIVATADDAIVSKTLEGRITSWNDGARRIFGYTETEVIGRPITLLIPPDRQMEEEAILARLKRGQRIDHFETERVTKDGRRIPVSITVSPVKSHDGRIIGASKIARDISDRRRFEREREDLLSRERSARAEAQAANRAKDEFLAMLAHELRNPVGVIVNALAILDQPAASAESSERARRVARRQTEHLAQLLDDLLDVARITGGRVELDRVAVDLRQTIKDAIESVRLRFEARQHAVRMTLHPGPVTVVGDPVRLHQVLGNLLHNAWKYTPTGGSVTVSLEVEGGEAVIIIQDTGLGIPVEKLEAIFELFTQANPTLARTEGGLGIGLALVRKLVNEHGGHVEAESDGLGCGSRFTVRLPLAPESTVVRPNSVTPLPLGRQRLLVIEDNHDGREMLASVLRLSGHEVHAAATGAEGIEIAMRERPDIVLLDIGLPDLDGFYVGRELRQRLGAAVRLVALTGYGQPQERKRTREAGFDAHVVKPVEPAALNQLMHRLAKRGTTPPDPAQG